MENIHAFIIAIENYTAGGLSKVPHAEADAIAFKKVLEQNGVPPENITILVNSDANADNVRYYLFNAIKNLTRSDRFIFFYAGHGTRREFDSRENYLTTHGCRDDYLFEPAIKIKDIVKSIEDSNCKNSCLFIDACHSELSANASIRTPLSKFSPDTLTEETGSSEYLVCFSACSKDQKSYSSTVLQHGIWSYYLIQALTGAVPQVLEERSVISSKLQDYLAESVVKHVKMEHGASNRQTPRMSGSMTDSFQVLVLPPLPQSENVDPLSFHLFGSVEGNLRDLSKWNSHYQNWGNEGFLYSAAEAEMEEYKNSIFKQLRSGLKLKNSQIKPSELGQGFVLETPDCSVSAWIKYSSTHEDSYVIEFEISELSDIATTYKLNLPPISKLINGACKLLSNIDLKASINALEDADFEIETDAENTFFETEYEEPDFVVRGSEERLVITTDSDLSLREIAESSADILSEIKQHLKFKEFKRSRTR
jgi:Caspase domain